MSTESILGISETLNTVLVLLIIGAFALTALRLMKGPSYADRFVAIDMLTGLAVAACALTALTTGRSEFLDVAFALALIAFVATAAFAAFLERKVAVTESRLQNNGQPNANEAAQQETS